MEYRIEIRDVSDNKIKDWYEATAPQLLSINKGDVLVSTNKEHFFEVVAVFHTYLGATKHIKVIYVQEKHNLLIDYSNLINELK
jgi:hypothetical protein